MLIATWNVNGIRARFPRLLEWLSERKPDVVCLQELKIEDAQFPALELRAQGYHAVTFGQKSWNGVAVLSREPIEESVRGLEGSPDMGSRLVGVRLGDLEVASIYVPNGKTVSHEDYPRKLEFLGALGAYLERRAPAGKFILGGDFNLCPTDLDTYDPVGLKGHIFHTDQERALYTRLIQAGMVDLFPHKKPGEQVFTWWDHRAGAFHKKQGLRIDFLLGSADIAARVRDIFVDREFRKKSKDGHGPSDHAPVVADIDLS
ncbi:MAG: exodeoxyribonuclease III [Polyangiaceae bacterium]